MIFFCTVKLRSNNIYHSSTSSIFLLLDNYKIINPQITNYCTVGSIACPFVVVRHVVGPGQA